MKYFIIIFFVFFLNVVLGEGNLNIVLLVNDSKMSTIDVKKMTEIIYLNNDYNVNNFSVIQFSKISNSVETWTKKKKIVNYKSTLIDCNFDICSKISGIIDYTRTVDSKLYFTEENQLSCNFNSNYIPIIQLANNQYTTISDEIKSENKSIKKEKTLFFYISGKTVLKNEVLFLKDTLEIEESKRLTLTPIYKQNYKSYKWEGDNGLNCYDCKFPEFSSNKSSQFRVICIDSLGCEIKSKKIFINVIKSCQNGYQSSNLLLDNSISGKYVFVNKKGLNDHDWNISSNSAGGLQFDFVASSNCADSYLVEILDLQGLVVWKKNYNKKDVDFRSKNNFHTLYPEYNVFRLTLNSLHDKISPPEGDDNLYFFKIRISSMDNLNNKYDQYISPRLLFLHCD